MRIPSRSSVELVEGDIVIPDGSSLYHCARDLGKLIADGYFRAEMLGGGGVHLTRQPTTLTNCAVEVRGDMLFWDSSARGRIQYFETRGVELGVGRNTYEASEILGYDGRIALVDDTYTQLPGGGFCEELKVFPSSLGKLINIRQAGRC